MSAPEWSPNAKRVLEAAVEFAKVNKHSWVGTEHLARSIAHSGNRAVHWAAKQAFSGEREYLSLFQRAVDLYFASRPLLFHGVDENYSELPQYSDTLKRVINIAEQIGSVPVSDGDIVYRNGLVASEFFLAAIMLEGTGVGADMFSRITSGAVNTEAVLHAIKVNPSRLLRPSVSEGAWEQATVPDSLSTSSDHRGCWYPNSFDDLTSGSIPNAPTQCSNWLIPDHLLIGEHPSKADFQALIASGVDTFVSLIGEYNFSQYLTTQYPSGLSRSQGSAPVCVQVVHFPIRDFGTVAPESLKSIVEELKRRVISGHVLYVHCRGGHGRTGMVVIPLLCALYDVPLQQAQAYVLHSTGTTRETDKRYSQYLHMPETDEQVASARAVEPLLRKFSRSGDRYAK